MADCLNKWKVFGGIIWSRLEKSTEADSVNVQPGSGLLLDSSTFKRWQLPLYRGRALRVRRVIDDNRRSLHVGRARLRVDPGQLRPGRGLASATRQVLAGPASAGAARVPLGAVRG